MKVCRKKSHKYSDILSRCPECVKIKNRNHYSKNQSKLLAKKKIFYLNNKESIKIAQKNYYDKNKKNIRLNQKEYNSKNKENLAKYFCKYYSENKEKNKSSRKKYADSYKSRKNILSKNRRLTDVHFRIACNLRNRLRKAIKNNYKNGSAVKDLGCSVEFLKKYLELQFQKGMSWENYGIGIDRWSIDHIVALSVVDLTIEEEFLKVNHFSNLRPLWNKDQLTIYYKEQIRG